MDFDLHDLKIMLQFFLLVILFLILKCHTSYRLKSQIVLQRFLLQYLIPFIPFPPPQKILRSTTLALLLDFASISLKNSLILKLHYRSSLSIFLLIYHYDSYRFNSSSHPPNIIIS